MLAVLADAVLLLHLGIVVFIVGGLVLVFAGRAFGWAWIHRRSFRRLHLLAIGVVVGLSWLGQTCPLTALESWLRVRSGQAGYEVGFIQHWVHAILFFDAPAWAFALLYTTFGGFVVLAWWRVPPAASRLGGRQVDAQVDAQRGGATPVAAGAPPAGGRGPTRSASPMPSGRPPPRVGVGVLVLRDGQVLLGRRRGAHGAGSWSAPGGRLEFGETIEDCARRELREETGLELGPAQIGPYTNDVFAEEGQHFVTLLIVARQARGTPRNLEPHKCEGWQWFPWTALPKPLFAPLATLVAQGYTPDAAP